MKTTLQLVCYSRCLSTTRYLLLAAATQSLSIQGYSQDIADSSTHLSTLPVQSRPPVERAIEVYKVKSNRAITIDSTRTVWIRCYNEKGKSRVKKAKISAIDGHKITFKPLNPKFPEVTYADSDMPYIGFTSVGRFTIALVSNIIIIGTLPILVLFVVALDPYSLGSIGSGSGLKNGILVPFRKDIDFHKDPRWSVRVVQVPMPSTQAPSKL